jgi:amidase
VLEVLDRTRAILVDQGAEVSDVDTDLFEGADQCWQTIEMLLFVDFFGADVERYGDALSADLIRNVEEGRSLTAGAILHALNTRSEIFRRTALLLQDHDVLALPATPIVSVGADVAWPREIAGAELDRYFQWQRLACRVTVTAHPALSVPAGFSADGLPVGLQLVGRHRGELALLCQAAAIEAATGLTTRHPPL